MHRKHAFGSRFSGMPQEDSGRLVYTAAARRTGTC
jgi:hypothetical protein